MFLYVVVCYVLKKYAMKTERAKFVLATWGLIYKKIVTTKLRQNV